MIQLAPGERSAATAPPMSSGKPTRPSAVSEATLAGARGRAPSWSFKLGYAGGPLVVGLILGRVGRTGPLFWTLPFSANLTLRQLGLVLFLAGVGTRSGDAFASKLLAGQGEPSSNDQPATITKIVVAQLLFVWVR